MLKTKRLALKVLPAHKLALARLAQAEDVSEATIVRRLIRAEAERRCFWLDDPASADDHGRTARFPREASDERPPETVLPIGCRRGATMPGA